MGGCASTTTSIDLTISSSSTSSTDPTNIISFTSVPSMDTLSGSEKRLRDLGDEGDQDLGRDGDIDMATLRISECLVVEDVPLQLRPEFESLEVEDKSRRGG